MKIVETGPRRCRDRAGREMGGFTMKAGQIAIIGRKQRLWLWIAASAAAFVLLSATAAGLFLYYSLKNTSDNMYRPIPQKRHYASQDREVKEKVQEQASIEDLAPFSVLLLGVDQRPSDRGRSDTIIILTVNPKAGVTFMFNIPRDTRTKLVKRGFDDKINHAYAYDGIQGSLETVEHFLDMPIDYYVEVNMEGFRTIVDLLNGVDVDNPFAFQYEDDSFPKGVQHLDGEMALKYSRMRYDDPRGDFGRNERQRQVIRDLLHRASQWNGMLELPGILRAIGDHVKTNLTFNQMQDLFTKYRTKVDTVESTEIKGKGTRINGIYYYLVDNGERTRMHNAMKVHILS